VAQHHVELIEGFSVAGMWSGLCSCGRILGDGTHEQVEQEVRAHQAEPEPPSPEPWTPSKHPIEDFRMR
jgi:hypothetical protein